MPKLVSTVTEALAIKGMCSKTHAVRGLLMSRLNESYFRTKQAKESYEYIMGYVRTKGEPPAYKMLCESLKLSAETRDFLQAVEGNPKTLEAAQQIVETLNGYRKCYLFYEMSKEVLEELEKKKVDIDVLTDRSISLLSEIQTGRDVADSTFHFGKDHNADDLVHKILYDEDDDQIIPTGYKAWDDKNGGLPRGSLVMLCGSTGAGKSQNVVQLGINQARFGYKVTVVPLEMSEEAITTRYMANLSGIDSLKIMRKLLATDEKTFIEEKVKKFKNRTAKKNGRFTIFKPKSDITIEELIASLHSYNSDVIYIDYISLLKGAAGEDQWRKLGEIARYAAVYADVHKKVVVLLAQVSEEGKIRYSQAVKEHAAVMWSFVATKESKEQGYLKYEVQKSRNQAGNSFSMKIDYSVSRITDFENEEAPEDEDSKEQRSAKDKGSKTKNKNKKGSKSEDDTMPDLTGDE